MVGGEGAEFVSPNWWVAGGSKAEASDVMDLRRMKRPVLELGSRGSRGRFSRVDKFTSGCAEFQVLVGY